MRVVIVSNYLPPNPGGVEFVVDSLGRAYTEAGHECVVVGFGTSRCDGWSAPYRRIGLRGSNVLERWSVPVPLVEPVGSVRRLRGALAGADALHVHGLPYPASMLALACCPRRARVVVTEHVGSVPYGHTAVDAVQRAAMRVGAALARRRDARIVVLNDRVAAELARVLGVGRIAKGLNGVDLEFFRPAATEVERVELRARLGFSRPTVLVVARSARKKGLDLAVAALSHLDDVGLVLCGSGTHTLEVPNQVTALGPVSRDQLADLYRAADVLLLPSNGEGMPLVVLEAMASGLPVVLGDDADVVRELGAGSVVSVERDAGAIRATVLGLISNESERARLAENGRFVVESRFTWPSVATFYLDLLSPTEPENAG